MATAFVLRFQEECEPDNVAGVIAGTMTTTKTCTEQPDSDPTQAEYTALSRAALRAGTVTNTRMETEQGDTDRSGGPHAIPRHPIEMATKTITAVQAEATDDDPGRIQNQILPRCS
jgi:hypothetical protein